jgi:uncharacterized Ntn-hydrolase superfamily protein
MQTHRLVPLLLTLAACHTASAPPASDVEPPVATFSICAYEPATGEIGVAVQSKFLGVGSVVPWAKAGVGAVATQAYANTTFGPRGLELMAQGVPVEEVLARLLASDDGFERRQVGMIDLNGNAATYTGSGCTSWAGGMTGKNFCVQGNILAGEKVVEAMVMGFETTSGDLGDRMLAALAAGQSVGGDRRGMQSAALLIVRDKAGYGGFNDRYRDLRVEDHPKPIDELKRIYELHKRTFPRRDAARRRGT